jgi:hypothetical protein
VCDESRCNYTVLCELYSSHVPKKTLHDRDTSQMSDAWGTRPLSFDSTKKLMKCCGRLSVRMSCRGQSNVCTKEVHSHIAHANLLTILQKCSEYKCNMHIMALATRYNTPRSYQETHHPIIYTAVCLGMYRLRMLLYCDCTIVIP